jgi:hypothetical protein
MTGEAVVDADAFAVEVAKILCTGLNEEQTRWAEDSLRDVILPSVWDDDTGDQSGVEALRSLVTSLAACTPDERWSDLVLAHYVSLLRPLQMSSILLGVKGEELGQGDRGWLAMEAEGVIAMLQALSEEIESFSSATYELLRDDLDAAIVDCDYVRNRDVMSPYLAAALSTSLD